MSHIPAELFYTAEHEWVTAPTAEGVVRVGITDFAQDALGDVVYVQVPDVGADVAADTVIGEVESTKSVSDIYAPLTGVVSARNDELESDSSVINSDPYGAGWLLEITLTDPNSYTSLLSADDYQEKVG